MKPPRRGNESSKLRVMHVTGSLGFGGIETWLIHMLRNQQDSPVQHEFLLTKEEVGPHEAEVRQMGIPVHRVPFHGNPLSWFARARSFLIEQRPTMVQSHPTLYFSAVVLAAALAAGVPIRIAHSHEARHLGRDHQTLRHRAMRLVAMRGLRLAATRKIAISEPAMHEIAGDGWQADPTASILLYGFDFSRNEGAAERVSALREQLNIPTDAKVIGHIGRFAPVKNHDFLLRVFGEFAKTEKRAHLVMVGQGELEPDIRALADELGLSSRVRFAGTSDDIPAFLSLFDLFLFPSFSEGLGIVCLEAQAAGTPSLVSTGIPEEVVVIPGAVEKLPLDSGVAQWAAAVERLMRSPPLDTGTWRSRVEESEYGIRRCVRDLNTIYRQELGRLQ